MPALKRKAKIQEWGGCRGIMPQIAKKRGGLVIATVTF